MVELLYHGRRGRQFCGIGWAVAALVGFGIALWSVDCSARPLASESSVQLLVESKAALKSAHEWLVSGQEALARYTQTGDRASLQEAREYLLDVSAHFSQSALQTGSFDPEDIITFARFSNLMSRYTGEEVLRHQAQEALRLLTGRERAHTSGVERSLQQAEEELHTSPLHITVVGSKNDAGAKMLWSEAVRVNEQYVRREWWDRSEGALPNPDVRYPKLASSAAFVCIDTRCSVPLYTDQELRERLAQMERAK